MKTAVKITVRMPDALYAIVKRRARKGGCSIHSFIVAAVVEKLIREEGPRRTRMKDLVHQSGKRPRWARQTGVNWARFGNIDQCPGCSVGSRG